MDRAQQLKKLELLMRFRITPTLTWNQAEALIQAAESIKQGLSIGLVSPDDSRFPPGTTVRLRQAITAIEREMDECREHVKAIQAQQQESI